MVWCKFAGRPDRHSLRSNIIEGVKLNHRGYFMKNSPRIRTFKIQSSRRNFDSIGFFFILKNCSLYMQEILVYFLCLIFTFSVLLCSTTPKFKVSSQLRVGFLPCMSITLRADCLLFPGSCLCFNISPPTHCTMLYKVKSMWSSPRQLLYSHFTDQPHVKCLTTKRCLRGFIDCTWLVMVKGLGAQYFHGAVWNCSQQIIFYRSCLELKSCCNPPYNSNYSLHEIYFPRIGCPTP